MSVLGLWHRHGLAPWGKSDVYCVVRLEPVDGGAGLEPRVDPDEISACRWYDVGAFQNDQDHPLIRKVLSEVYGVRPGDATPAVVAPRCEAPDLGVEWPGRDRYATYFPSAAPVALPARVAAVASDVDGTLLAGR